MGYKKLETKNESKKGRKNMGIEYFNIYVKRGPQTNQRLPKLLAYTLET